MYAGSVWQLDHSSRNDTCLLYTLYGCQGSDRSADTDSFTGSPWLWRADPLRHRTAANVTAKLNGFSCAGTKTNYSNGEQVLLYASAIPSYDPYSEHHSWSVRQWIVSLTARVRIMGMILRIWLCHSRESEGTKRRWSRSLSVDGSPNFASTVKAIVYIPFISSCRIGRMYLLCISSRPIGHYLFAKVSSYFLF